MRRIIFDRHRRPFIRDTGIGLWELVGWIASGQSEEQVLSEHPELEPADLPESYSWARLLTATLEFPSLTKHRFAGRQERGACLPDGITRRAERG